MKRPIASKRTANAPRRTEAEVLAPELPPEPKPEAEPDHPAIRVEVDSVVGGWNAGPRFDVLLRGRILSQARADMFSIHTALGQELGAIQFGQADSGQLVELPGGNSGFSTGFQVYLPMPGGDEIRIADLWVRARDQDGATFEEAMRLGCMGGNAAILAGPSHDMADTEVPQPAGMVYLETAELTADGILRATGWALASSPVVAVQIFVGGIRVGAAAQGIARGDVAEAYPAYPNARASGFSLERALGHTTLGVAQVTAQVLCLSGACLSTTIPLFRHEQRRDTTSDGREHEPIGAGPAQIQDAGSPIGEDRQHASETSGDAAPRAVANTPAPAGGGFDLGRAILLICDHATVSSDSVLTVEGWAACGQGIERIEIHVDGEKAGHAEYGRERADVASEFPGMPVGTGYRFETAIPGLAGGPHEVTIVGFNRVGDNKAVTAAAAPPEARFRFELDNPVTRDGAMVTPVTGRLAIEGWVLCRDGIAAIDIELDGTMLGQAHYGMARPDVGAAFPDWEGGTRSGYTFHCPSRALPDGEHEISIVARSRTGGSHVHTFRVTVRKTDDPEEAASIRRRIKRVERETVAGVLDQLDWHPSYHLIVAGAPAPGQGAAAKGIAGKAGADAGKGTAERAAALTIQSIVEQSWPDWRVTVLAPGAREAKAARAAIKRHANVHAGRFTVIDPSAAAWTRVMEADGDASLVAFLANGDELGRDALDTFAVASGIHRDAGCFYADEFRLAPGAARPEAFFKPDFSPALLLSSNYIGRPLVVRAALLAATGVTPESIHGDGFHDLTLRCTEAAAETHHIPELLSRTDGGVAPGPDDGAALTRAMRRRGIAAEVLPGATAGTWRVRRTTPVSGKVSIIIPTCAAKGYIATCLKSLREVTAYKNFEIVCIDNIPKAEKSWKKLVRDGADKVVSMPPPFNWSRFNNEAAAASDGEYLLFLNDDIEIEQPGWLDAMLEAAAWPGVGIVGPRLLYPNRTVQHAGMFLGDGMGRHAFRHAEETDGGYFGLALTQREVIAVTGACLLVRRDTFEHLGRFDEAHDVVNNDLDFCLRAHRAGLRAIYTPHATLIHHELASRDHLPDDFDTTRFSGEWRALFAAGDPYFNPRLSRYSDDYRVDDEGVRAVFAAHPLIDRASVKAILVVKVDHIGDFITSLPAIRGLKAAFPGARLTALVAPASAAIASVEPAIDECIPFEFFHARSELGEKDLTDAELADLTARLAPYRFDIAVDLRKHLSTRHLLLCSGARVLAGYDSIETFPWLDVVLEWEGDKALQRKRSHIVDDLVNLAAAIDAACAADRRLFDPIPEPFTARELPAHVRHLFARPVVAIHPGSGNVMRQYPEKHIPPLIDLLIARDDVAVLLVGGPDDEEKVASIMAQVSRPDRVASVAGIVKLRDLPRMLAACALFIGGNSGPKHIAAASGVPTIGIHSGVVDPGEWGPVGRRAVAMYRDMNCAPCFLAKPEQCPRGMACVEMLEPALVHRMAQMFLARRERRAPVCTAAPGASALGSNAPVPARAEPSGRKRSRRMQVADSK